MKRKIISITLVLLLLFSVSGFSFAADKDINVYIDGKELITDNEPFIQSGRVYVPMRAIFETMGAKVEWNNETRLIVATKGLIRINMTVAMNFLTKNNKTVALDSGPIIKDSTTYVPARAVAESLNANVEWKSGNVYISSSTMGYIEYPAVPDFGKMFNCKEQKLEILEFGSNTDNVMSGYSRTYKDGNVNAENIKAYKESLLNQGYSLWQTTNDSYPIEMYKNKENTSMVSISSVSDRLVIILQTVPMTLNQLGLEATK